MSLVEMVVSEWVAEWSRSDEASREMLKRIRASTCNALTTCTTSKSVSPHVCLLLP